TPLKKMLYDMDQVYGRQEGYLERVSHAVDQWDYLISPSSYATQRFRSAFRFQKEILEVGYPRNDIFYQRDLEERIKRLKRSLRIPKGKKVILYAPTFRDDETKGENQFVFDLQFDMERMKEALSEDYIILLRMHVVIKNQIQIPEEFQEFIFNVTSYPDIQDLLLVSDILITDYSSVMFDYANLRRPMLFYTYDLEKYRDDVRGFYIDLEEEAPGPLLRDTDELITSIKQIDEVCENYNIRYDD